MAQSRRRFLASGVLASLATVLAGCQGSDGDTEDGGDGDNGDGGGDTEDGGGGDSENGGGDGDTTQSTATDDGSGDGGGEVTVEMGGSAFDPRNLEIEVGTTVVWANQDSFGHTVTSASDNWSLDREVSGGGSTSFTFDAEGVYDVYCRFHGGEDLSGMSMKVAAGAATIENPLGSGSGDDGGTTGDDTTTTGGGGGEGSGGGGGGGSAGSY